ncbi:MAG TPA: sulfatase-like hydrolase/transferase [Pyrinomonadaceae bacterium]
MNRVILACVFAFVCASPAPARGVRRARPNIVVILADDLGYGDLSGFGAKDIKTPNIDALAAAGARFENFYANSPVCSPSRAALLTGRYPDLVGVPGVIREDPRDSWGHLSPRVRLLPEVLRRAGYDTALVGKWHLGLASPNLPNERGFRLFRGFLGDMMDDYLTHLRGGVNFMRENRRAVSPRGHATDLFTRWAVEYLDSRARSRQPFFLYLAYNAPHVPLQPPPEFLERVRRREPGLGDGNRLYLAALVEHLDEGVGRVVEALKRNGQWGNTLVVFASDNGGQLSAGASNAPLRGGKQEMYEGGIRVPACAAWPGRIGPGSRTSRVALLMDLWPTLLEASGVRRPPAVDGVSVLPALLGRDEAGAARTLFWVRREGGGFYLGQDYYAARRGPRKLMQNHPYMPFRLYNLDADPGEQRDVAAENRAVVEELAGALREHLRRAGAVPWQAVPP